MTDTDRQLSLAMAVLKRLAQSSSPDSLSLAVGAAARDIDMPREEACLMLKPLFQTQRESVHYRMFWGGNGGL
jgi:hypothetical protein